VGIDMAEDPPQDDRIQRDEKRELYHQYMYEREGIDDPSELNTTIQVRVNDQIKELWNKSIERSHYNSMAELVRVAVGKELSGRYDRQERQTDEVLDAVSEVQRTLETLENEVRGQYADLVTEDDVQQLLEVVSGVEQDDG
jgi:Arc/MetJ-type ribon-helix-helix transcriptional regulator